MAVVGTEFIVPVRGVGKRDYHVTVHRSVQPFLTPAERQDEFALTGATYTDVPTRPFATGYDVLYPLPQADGSWDYVAGDIVAHIYNYSASLRTLSLMAIDIFRYASWGDYLTNVIAERFRTKWGYGRVDMLFSKGIPTKKGSVYCMWFGAWPETPTFDITLQSNGLLTELTPPWMP